MANTAKKLHLTGVERFMKENEFIVSKTNLKGHITYANDVFLRIAGYTMKEVFSQPHSMIRHPHMPRCVFKLLWDTIQNGNEIFAYVVNRSKNGDHYWVFAHVTPSYDNNGKIVGFHSNRRPVKKQAIATVEPLYKKLVIEENRHANRKQGVQSSFNMLGDLLKTKGVSYEEFVFAI